jgi:hypothetical protein
MASTSCNTPRCPFRVKEGDRGKPPRWLLLPNGRRYPARNGRSCSRCRRGTPVRVAPERVGQLNIFEELELRGLRLRLLALLRRETMRKALIAD